MHLPYALFIILTTLLVKQAIATRIVYQILGSAVSLICRLKPPLACRWWVFKDHVSVEISLCFCPTQTSTTEKFTFWSITWMTDLITICVVFTVIETLFEIRTSLRLNGSGSIAKASYFFQPCAIGGLCSASINGILVAVSYISLLIWFYHASNGWWTSYPFTISRISIT